MNPVPGLERFLSLTGRLGVVDVRSIETKCILVLTSPDTNEEKLDAIRLLALAAWPDIPVMIGRRASIRESGSHRIVEVHLATDLGEEWREDETG